MIAEIFENGTRKWRFRPIWPTSSRNPSEFGQDVAIRWQARTHVRLSVTAVTGRG